MIGDCGGDAHRQLHRRCTHLLPVFKAFYLNKYIGYETLP